MLVLGQLFYGRSGVPFRRTPNTHEIKGRQSGNLTGYAQGSEGTSRPTGRIAEERLSPLQTARRPRTLYAKPLNRWLLFSDRLEKSPNHCRSRAPRRELSPACSPRPGPVYFDVLRNLLPQNRRRSDTPFLSD